MKNRSRFAVIRQRIDQNQDGTVVANFRDLVVHVAHRWLGGSLLVSPAPGMAVRCRSGDPIHQISIELKQIGVGPDGDEMGWMVVSWG